MPLYYCSFSSSFFECVRFYYFKLLWKLKLKKKKTQIAFIGSTLPDIRDCDWIQNMISKIKLNFNKQIERKIKLFLYETEWQKEIIVARKKKKIIKETYLIGKFTIYITAEQSGTNFWYQLR